MGPLLAWLPFLTALLLAFAAGVAFARINEGLVAGPAEQPRHGRFARLYRADFILTSVLVGLLVAVLLVWVISVVTLLMRRA